MSQRSLHALIVLLASAAIGVANGGSPRAAVTILAIVPILQVWSLEVLRAAIAQREPVE